jgi:hypothetical protein
VLWRIHLHPPTSRRDVSAKDTAVTNRHFDSSPSLENFFVDLTLEISLDVPRFCQQQIFWDVSSTHQTFFPKEDDA